MSYRDIDAPLPYEVCVRLKELSFPQGNFPQMVWTTYGRPRLLWKPDHTSMNQHLSAPTPLTALAWLAEVKGIYVNGFLSVSGNSWWATEAVNRIETETYDNPADLVRAIVEALK